MESPETPRVTNNSTDTAFNQLNPSSKKTKCSACYLTLSILSLVVGIAMVAGGYNAMFDAILKKQMEVVPGSTSYDIWKDTPVPLTLAFYFYNITNPDEFKNGSKPIVNEVGPYVYGEFHQKTHITFDTDPTVSFYQQRWWVWDQEASGGNYEDDIISLVNPSAAYSVSKNSFLLTGLNVVLIDVGEEIMLYKTVREVLFDGFQDPLLDLVHNITGDPDSSYPDIAETLPPGLTDYDKFGWFYKRNLSETFDGNFTMNTGVEHLEDLGKIIQWNGLTETDFFSSPCNKISGSAGELWPPEQSATNISFFNSDLCMTITLPYKEQVVDDFGLNGFRYWADNRTFGHPDIVPENQCYCYENNTLNCPPSGLLDAQTCRMGSPAYISFPHFLHADPKLFDDIVGMAQPDEERDQFMIDMIPELGVPILVKARMQINLQIAPYPGTGPLDLGQITILSKIPKLILPLLWFEVNAGITEELAADLKPVMFLLHTPTITIIWSLMIVIPTIVIAIFFACLFMKRNRKSDQLPLVE